MDIMKEQKPVGPSWKGFEQFFCEVVVSPLPGENDPNWLIFFKMGWNHQLVFWEGGCAKKNKHDYQRGWESCGSWLEWYSEILVDHFLFSILWVFNESVSFPQASKPKNSQVLNMLNHLPTKKTE